MRMQMRVNPDNSQANAFSPPAPAGGLNFIEQLAARAIVRCPNPKSPILRATNQRLKVQHYLKAACGMWSCPVCSTKNAQKWIARILTGVNAHLDDTWSFVTVTAHEKTRGTTSLVNLRSGWPRLLRRLKRAVDYDVRYVMVYEPHADDENSLHMHMIINVQLGTKWWKDNARSCGMGYQDHEGIVTNAGQAAGYCAKYLLKASDKCDQYEKHMRRINCSRNWEPLPKLSSDEDEYEWTHVISVEKMDHQAQVYRRLGYVVTGDKEVKRQYRNDMKKAVSLTNGP